MSPSNGPADLIDPVLGDRRGGGWSRLPALQRSRIPQPDRACRFGAGAAGGHHAGHATKSGWTVCCKWHGLTNAPPMLGAARLGVA